MAPRNLNDLIYTALEGAARAIVTYCNSVSSEQHPGSSGKDVEKKALVQEVSHSEVPAKDESGTPQVDTSHYPDTEDISEKSGFGFEPTDRPEEVVEGVPLNHPIHADVTELLPGFRAVCAMVEQPDFLVTPESVEKAMPVWVAFNALSRYRDDEHFPAILAYVRTYIKPVCFSAMGKEVAK